MELRYLNSYRKVRSKLLITPRNLGTLSNIILSFISFKSTTKLEKLKKKKLVESFAIVGHANRLKGVHFLSTILIGAGGQFWIHEFLV